jgi:hypothetical protein
VITDSHQLCKIINVYAQIIQFSFDQFYQVLN